MKPKLSLRSVGLLMILAIAISLIPLACRRDNRIPEQVSEGNATGKINSIKKWWEDLKAHSPGRQDEVATRIPDGMTIQAYWQGQFQNGTPKWADARMYTVDDETIYEVPFQFPDHLLLLNEKPDASPQFFLTSKEGLSPTVKTSQTYLVVKQKPGTSNVAEIMCTVLSSAYVKMLDTIGGTYPSIGISNVYPSVNNMGDFTGSVKFYDLDGVQLLEEGYVNGSLTDYVQYGRCNFLLTPTPNFSTDRTYQVCTWTYVYQQTCAPDAGCTDWDLIGVIFNGCETIVVPDSPPVILPPSDGGSGSGGSYPSPPAIQQNPPIPNADLCGKYTWKRIGESHTAQICNMGATFRYTRANGSFYDQTIVLGWICVTYPKWVKDQGYNIDQFVNRAFNEAKWTVLFELNNNLLAGSSAAILPRFKQLMTSYIKETGSIEVNTATISYQNGCQGNIPVSYPKWCAPL